jgi:hypothetical protein
LFGGISLYLSWEIIFSELKRSRAGCGESIDIQTEFCQYAPRSRAGL